MATDTSNAKEKSTYEQVKQEGREAAHEIGERTKEAASSVADKAKNIASKARDQADQGVSSAGKGMESAADYMRDKGPQSGMLGSANKYMADTLEKGGQYLEEQGLSGMAEDVTEVIRRNPIPAVLISVGIGFLLARMTTPRS